MSVTPPAQAKSVADRAAESFAAHTANHEMKVLHDDGLYRHVRFAQLGTRSYAFELVTWPGYLAMAGDMGEWVFTRLPDMFEFFASDRGMNRYYWAEKCKAHDGLRAYDPRTATAHVRETLEGWLEEFDDQDASEPQGLVSAVETQILAYVEDETQLRSALDEFVHEGVRGRARYTFEDAWEWDMREFTFHFLWACHAIRWGVEQYRTGAQS